jgi:hypothetical protein
LQINILWAAHGHRAAGHGQADTGLVSWFVSVAQGVIGICSLAGLPEPPLTRCLPEAFSEKEKREAKSKFVFISLAGAQGQQHHRYIKTLR